MDIQENLKNHPIIKPAVGMTYEGKERTKVQLFNAIRKYLNPTLIAFLRMEMFEDCEPEYRPDEKQVLKELIKLGPDVYEYFCNEWRFRLPPAEVVLEWLDESDEIC